MIREILEDKGGKLQKALIILGVIFLILLIGLGINAAQEITEDNPSEEPAVEEQVEAPQEETPTVETSPEETSQVEEIILDPSTDIETAPEVDESLNSNKIKQEQESEEPTTQSSQPNQSEVSSDSSSSQSSNESVEQTDNNESEDNYEDTGSESEIMDLCFDVACDNSELTCEGGFVASCSNDCNLETGECEECIPDCAGHEIEPIIIETEKTQIPLEPKETETPEISQSDLELEIFHDSKALRGENLEVKAVIENKGTKVNDVVLNWILPKDFKIIFGSLTQKCGDLENKETCESIVEVEISGSASLRKDEIKVLVDYKYGN